MVTVGSGLSVPVCVIDPLTTAWETGPKPLAYITTVSPGLAGVVEPGKRLVGPTRLLSAPCCARTYGPAAIKNDGESAFDDTVAGALFTPLLFTTTCTGPRMASGGVRMFTCVGLM